MPVLASLQPDGCKLSVLLTTRWLQTICVINFLMCKTNVCNFSCIKILSESFPSYYLLFGTLSLRIGGIFREEICITQADSMQIWHLGTIWRLRNQENQQELISTMKMLLLLLFVSGNRSGICLYLFIPPIICAIKLLTSCCQGVYILWASLLSGFYILWPSLLSWCLYLLVIPAIRVFIL